MSSALPPGRLEPLQLLQAATHFGETTASLARTIASVPERHSGNRRVRINRGACSRRHPALSGDALSI